MAVPGDVGVAVAAGHVQGRPAVLVPLVDVSAVFHQELDAVQVSRQHGFVQRCHACRDRGLALPGKGSLSTLHSQLRKGVLALSFSGRGRWGKKHRLRKPEGLLWAA